VDEATYRYFDSAKGHTAGYLWSPVVAALRAQQASTILDLGCGNGAFVSHLENLGFDVIGCDPSEDGIRIAREAVPKAGFHRLGVYDDPALLKESRFDAVVALEVIEHLYAPRALLRFARALLKPSGVLLATTPYHGYLKNLVLSLVNGWDRHWDPRWDGGHIKFWSRATLEALMMEENFRPIGFEGAGRVPLLWKSMIVSARLE